MKTQTTAIDERHFRPDPEGKRKFLLHDWPPQDTATTRDPDHTPNQTATGSAPAGVPPPIVSGSDRAPAAHHVKDVCPAADRLTHALDNARLDTRPGVPALGRRVVAEHSTRDGVGQITEFSASMSNRHPRRAK